MLLPETLTLAQLQRLAASCGLSKAGPKQPLRRRIADAVAAARPLPPTARVLSIDMGIRNLAFSLLTPAPGPAPGPPALDARPRATLHAWRRQDLLSVPGPAAGDGPEGDAGPTAAAAAAAAALLDGFAPASLSAAAVRLVRDQLLPLRPTHVLVERQRYRSGGGAAVQEWTLRVNSLEAMLYASLATLRDLGRWRGAVVPVEPARVAPFLLGRAGGWLPGWEGPAAAAAAGARGAAAAASKREGKRAKVEMLARWLEEADGGVRPVGEEAEGMVGAFLAAAERKAGPGGRSGGRKKAEGGAAAAAASDAAAPGKLDDLADSLLQGLVFMAWEANKAALGERGVEPFLGHLEGGN